MVRAGFQLKEIEEMTIKQLEIYSKAYIKRKIQDDISLMGLTRAAYHADEQGYSSIIRDMENY